MRVIRCTSGHYYDVDMFFACPHCAMANHSPQISLSAQNMQKIQNQGYTLAPQTPVEEQSSEDLTKPMDALDAGDLAKSDDTQDPGDLAVPVDAQSAGDTQEYQQTPEYPQNAGYAQTPEYPQNAGYAQTPEYPQNVGYSQTPQNWICPICQNVNDPSETFCNVCGRLKDIE